jgi:hypothetical protein
MLGHLLQSHWPGRPFRTLHLIPPLGQSRLRFPSGIIISSATSQP